MSRYSIVLDVSGSEFDVDLFLEGIELSENDSIWHRGEPTLVRGKECENSGFRIFMGEGDSLDSMIFQSVSLLQEKLKNKLMTNLPGYSKCLRVGFFWDVDSSLAVQSIEMTNESMRLLVELGISLSVSIYPCED
jgi:hypothetical protein